MSMIICDRDATRVGVATRRDGRAGARSPRREDNRDTDIFYLFV
jgi:hypothetical protein